MEAFQGRELRGILAKCLNLWVQKLVIVYLWIVNKKFQILLPLNFGNFKRIHNLKCFHVLHARKPFLRLLLPIENIVAIDVKGVKRSSRMIKE